MVSWFTILLVIGITAFTVYLLKIYPSKKTQYYVYFFVFIGWYLAFVIVTVLPYDVYLSLGGEGNKDDLHVCWNIIYWIIFALCWALLPMMQNYHMAGEFTFLTKMKRAFITRLRMIGITLVMGVIFILYLVISGNFASHRLPAILVALSNIWSLFIIMVLLGYGLVYIPKTFWQNGSLDTSMKLAQLKAVELDQSKIEAKYNLDQTVGIVMKLSRDVTEVDPLHKYVDKLLEKCPQQSIEHQKSTRSLRSMEAHDEKKEITYKYLVGVNRDLKKNIAEFGRSESRWEQHLEAAFRLEDIIANKKNSNKWIRSNFWPAKNGKYARFREVFEWIWYTRLSPILCRLLGLLLSVVSIFVVLGEITLFVDTPIGVFPLFFKDNHGSVGTLILCFMPLLYIIASIYVSLFKLRLKGRYGLYSHNQTDPPNLIWSAFIMARLTPSVCYNFLLFIKVKHTQFNKVMGVIDLVPIFGQGFTLFFPMILIVFCLLNITNFYARLMEKMGMDQYSFADKIDDAKLLEGKSLLHKARSDRERGSKGTITPSGSFVESGGYNAQIRSKYEHIRKSLAEERKNSITAPLKQKDIYDF
ncbi:LMBRD2_1 [Blepharisma stoltei]|uniref:LMBR1 domain-containing protein 2 n=1 Tax=Blepharisma stoltei TaxID=1481888 RepID=A0AAU9INR0_9CILI|nr:unnamed protein product [Blepharisma stoltei]